MTHRSVQTASSSPGRHQLHRIVASLSDGVILIEPDGTIAWANDAARAKHGFTTLSELGSTVSGYHKRLVRWRICYTSHKKETAAVKLYIIAYLSTALTFLGCDVVWLSIAASRLYKPKLGPLLLNSFNTAPAIAFYLLYILGILVFAVFPALATARWTTALGRGALLGMVAYATYDLTNQATLKGWSTTVTIADLCWGTALTGIAATAGFFATHWFAER